MVFMQLFVNSLIIGSIYALVAAGFSLIYTTNKFLHIAHGVSIALGGYLLFLFFNLLGLPFAGACIIAIVLTSLIGLAMYQFVYLPLQKKKASTIILLIASLAILILVQNLIQLFFGANVKSIDYLKVREGISVFGAIITPLQIIIVLIALTLFVLLYLFMKKTTLGKNMRAVSDNKELASIIGIDYKKVAGASFLLGSMLAAVAGILIGMEQNIEPVMGTQLIIKGFTASIIGGIGSVAGVIPGAYILGFAENFGIWYLPSGYKDAIAFGLLFLFLLFRPQGLFGLKKGVKQ